VKRRVFNVLAAVSLVLCVAIVALWVRSYWRHDMLNCFGAARPGAVHNYGITSEQGKVDIFERWETYSHPPAGWSLVSTGSVLNVYRFTSWVPRSPGDRTVRFLSFGYRDTPTFSPPDNFRIFWFPHWFPALLFAVFPALRACSILRERRLHRAGFCHRCGYDMRATPERCPECGTAAGSRTVSGRSL
jgi:hypothetical protein